MAFNHQGSADSQATNPTEPLPTTRALRTHIETTFSGDSMERMLNGIADVLSLPLGKFDPVLRFIGQVHFLEELNEPTRQLLMEVYGAPRLLQLREALKPLYEQVKNEYSQRLYTIRACQINHARVQGCPWEIADFDEELGSMLRSQLESQEFFTLYQLTRYSAEDLLRRGFMRNDVAKIEALLEKRDLKFQSP